MQNYALKENNRVQSEMPYDQVAEGLGYRKECRLMCRSCNCCLCSVHFCHAHLNSSNALKSYCSNTKPKPDCAFEEAKIVANYNLLKSAIWCH